MNIPPTLLVGFQKRTDTYTGMLSYIVYKDAKGKIAKEKSWKGWIDKSIATQELPNDPTSGFVLNKGVGGYYRDRMAKIRVHDPRGFEFEITVENLLFILAETDSIKGKGLTGDFVYAWDKQHLVLLPVSCKDYTESVRYTSLKDKKIKKKDIVVGYTYTTKELEDLIYLGQYNCCTSTHHKKSAYYYFGDPVKPRHVFIGSGGKYHFYDDFKTFVTIANDTSVSNIGDLHLDFIQSDHMQEYDVIFEDVTNEVIAIAANSMRPAYDEYIFIRDDQGFFYRIYLCRGVHEAYYKNNKCIINGKVVHTKIKEHPLPAYKPVNTEEELIKKLSNRNYEFYMPEAYIPRNEVSSFQFLKLIAKRKKNDKQIGQEDSGSTEESRYEEEGAGI